MDKPLVSILVANYNNGHFFQDCYYSIISQTYQNWECVIVDDASTDNSVLLIKSIIGQDTRFSLYENETNKKCGYTKNKCARLATGAILGFLDPDDALVSNALAIMVEAHYKNADAAIITSKFELVHLDMTFKESSNRGGEIPHGASYLTYPSAALTHFATFKNVFYKKTNGIDIKMTRAVDQDLYYKMEEQGKHVFINKVLYRYRKHEESISSNQNSIKATYWHTYARIRAYKRRNKSSVPNLTKNQYQSLQSKYYFYKFYRARAERKNCARQYYYLIAIFFMPLSVKKQKIKRRFEGLGRRL